MNNKRYNALKLYEIKVNNKKFYFIKKPNDKIQRKIEEVSSNNYLILMLKEEIICDMINQIVHELINKNYNLKNHNHNLENNLINLVMGNTWIRDSNWIKLNFSKLKKHYDNDFYEIITFIYYNFFKFD